MTREQYERWKDFALRMAKTCFKGSRRPPEAWIIDQVESWFCWRDYRNDWDQYNSWDGEPYLCDHIDEFYDSERPSSPRCKACANYRRWSTEPDQDECKCDEISDLVYEQFSDQWLEPVYCCIRAGLGAAIEGGSGMGVLGFTAGDIRKMYPEGVPDWVKSGWDNGETIGVKAVCPGVGFVPEVVGACKPFDQIPDDAGLWL